MSIHLIPTVCGTAKLGGATLSGLQGRECREQCASDRTRSRSHWKEVLDVDEEEKTQALQQKLLRISLRKRQVVKQFDLCSALDPPPRPLAPSNPHSRCIVVCWTCFLSAPFFTGQRNNCEFVGDDNGQGDDMLFKSSVILDELSRLWAQARSTMRIFRAITTCSIASLTMFLVITAIINTCPSCCCHPRSSTQPHDCWSSSLRLHLHLHRP